jgi:light-independent protochlorophyllide reductase subunit B
MMGLEEHLLTMFRGDFEFHDAAPASHLGSTAVAAAPADAALPSLQPAATVASPAGALVWAADAEKELGKIPFFVRGKARRNTERFAAENAVDLITVETLYDAKAHFSR